MPQLKLETRKDLLNEYFSNNGILERLNDAPLLTPEERREQERLCSRQSQLLQLYREGLSKTPLARCPFSNEVYAPSFDSFGINGPWWNYYASQRSFEEPPGHWIALTGAMRLDQPVEKSPFLCIPGPGVPYVYTRLIENDAVKAVVYSLPIGRHIAYAIVYFATVWPDGVQMPNWWGTNFYQVHLSDGQAGWYQSFDGPEAWDFDLAKWIKRGKLLWIPPGDSGMALHSTVPDCPYIDLSGPREEQRVVHGAVEFGEPN